MADSFGVPQLTSYLQQMGLKIARTDLQQELLELTFHGNHGQWRIIVAFQQGGDVRKLMLIAPHIAVITTQKRLECLEALMAVNYRIAIGKFGIDLEDGEVRLEESVPLANERISYQQFRLVFSALMQTIAMYHSLLPRIIYGNFSVREALRACEQDFLSGTAARQTVKPIQDETSQQHHTELNVQDVLAEVSRIFEEQLD